MFIKICEDEQSRAVSSVPTHFSLCYFFSDAGSLGDMALADTEGQTGTSKDMPFYVRGSQGWSQRKACREVWGGLERGGKKHYSKPS